jgi:hypothetical protein
VPESLITAPENPEKAHENVQGSTQEETKTGTTTQGTETDAVKNLDPFGDANDFKDESGLYLGKYKTVQEVMKGYKELSGKLREKSPDAPETYEGINFKDDQDIPQEYRNLEVTAENDPLFKAFLPTFKAAKMSQEQVKILVKEHLLNTLKSQPDLNKEREKLGAEADSIIQAVTTYRDKRNTPAMQKLASIAGQDADLLKELNILIGASGERVIPGDLNNGGSESKSAAEWDAEAREYRTKHKKEMESGSKPHQDHYYGLLQKKIHAKS